MNRLARGPGRLPTAGRSVAAAGVLTAAVLLAGCGGTTPAPAPSAPSAPSTSATVDPAASAASSIEKAVTDAEATLDALDQDLAQDPAQD